VAGNRWKHYTTKTFIMRNVKCHHYFVHSKKDDTIAVIRE
jgi:surfactin synthase thioesterase subunit